MSSERVSYRFGPLERRGLLGGLGWGQAAALAAGALGAVLLLDAAPSSGGALGAFAVLALGLAVTVAPIARRTAGDWVPVLAAYALRAAAGRRGFRSSVPGSGMRWRGGHGHGTHVEPEVVRPPGSVRGARIVSAPYRDQSIGVLSEQRGRRLTAVLACRVLAFSLLDPEAQERRLARWGLVLSGAGGGPISRMQWIQRSAPARGDELARWLHAERDPAMPPRGTPMVESYLELISTTARVSQEHEVLVAIQVDERALRGRRPGSLTDTLLEQTERVAQGLEAAEVVVLGALGPRQLARTLRTAFDPYARAELAALETADPAREGLSEAGAWPLAEEEGWEHYRTDGATHATFWIGAWPRVEVSPMFMDALLGRASVVRTVSVTFEPIAPERSTREAEAAITRDRADRELRHRFGQSETARQRQMQEATARREAELAAGHGEVRFAGFVTVSGRDTGDLRRACAAVHEQAARSRLELHRMYGQQAAAFAFTLPLCRGLR